MDILYESYIQTLHPSQLLLLEEFLENSPSSTFIQRNFRRIVHIILRGKGQHISGLIKPGIKTIDLTHLFDEHPKLLELLSSVRQTVEGTREISKERDFGAALQKLYALRKKGFLPNIVTLKRLIIKTRGDIGKLKIIENIITEEGISKNKSYLFYAELIQSGSFRGSHTAGGNSYEGIRNSGKYNEAIAAGLSPDFAYALAQGQFGGSPRGSDIKATSHGKFRGRK